MSKITLNKGLEGIIAAETNISLVDGENGRLIYKGLWAKELAINNSFEEVCYLLWYDRLPNSVELDEFKEKLKQKRELPDYLVDIIKQLPEDMELMSVLKTCISALGTSKYSWPPTIEQGIELTSIIPTILAYRYRMLLNLNIIHPNKELGHVDNYLYMLRGEIPEDVHSKILNSYLILTMEHGMNASTFASRVIASTESDMNSAITGAIGAMKGPLHGGAPSGVIDMLDEIGSKDNVENWISNKLENNEKLMGFGHRVYKTNDPRADALREVIQSLTNQDEWLDLANHVEKEAIRLLKLYKPGRKLYTNVEFYAAAVLKSIELPVELFTPTFTSSRVSGWISNVLEQANNNRIYRPQSTYTGNIPNPQN